jgi:hypothetical protein
MIDKKIENPITVPCCATHQAAITKGRPMAARSLRKGDRCACSPNSHTDFPARRASQSAFDWRMNL